MCLSVPRRIPTLLHGPGCNLGERQGCPLVVHYGGFAIGERVSLLWQHSAERETSASASTGSGYGNCEQPIVKNRPLVVDGKHSYGAHKGTSLEFFYLVRTG